MRSPPSIRPPAGLSRRRAAWLLPIAGAVGAVAALALNGCGVDDNVAPPTVAGGDAMRGRLLLARYQCGACHQIPGVDAAQGSTGPALAGFGRRSYIAGFLPNYPDAMVRWIVDPPKLKPGTAMPAMGVSARDAGDMAAYLYTIK